MTSPVVKIYQGLVRGTMGNALSGQTFYKFLGIPFGKAPTEELRFKDPIPADPWNGIKDCSEPGDSCIQSIQKDGTMHGFEGSENCLNLNVFTRDLPKDPEDTNFKPVMVWIHGGGFVTGSNNPFFYGPEYLMNEDIVLVSINYRLGFLGFLRTKDANNQNIGGNMGFKDQVEALKWVKNNIAYFNGDPNNVTIFGESAGAVSVHYHVLSPKSRGLFHKAIMQSGAALNQWADAGSPFSDHSAQDLAKLTGYDVTSETEALEILRKVPAEEIVSAGLKFIKKSRGGILTGPCVEKPSETAFLTKKPIDLITTGEYNKVPMILGYNDMEGLLFRCPLFPIKGKLDFKNKIPYKTDAATQKNLVEKLESLYFKGGELTMEAEVDALTDAEFVFGIVTSAEKHAETSGCPVYLYKMSLDAPLNFLKKLFQLEEYKGAAHADDLGYLFNTFLNPEIEPGTIEEKSIHRFVKMWTNFAKCGNPTPDSKDLDVTWSPVNNKQLNTLLIDKELRIEVDPEEHRLQVWKDIYKIHPDKDNFENSTPELSHYERNVSLEDFNVEKM